jgi:hypothetical protein
VDGAALALHRPGGNGELRRPGFAATLPGSHPAIGDGHTAWIAGDTVVVEGVAAIPAPGANSVAVNAGWVAWRANGALYAASLTDATPRQIVIGDPGRPALAGNLLLFDLAQGTRIDAIDLTNGFRTTLRRARDAQLRGVSAQGTRIAYVYATYRRQQLRIGRLAIAPLSADHAIYGTVPTGRRDAGDEPGHRHAEGHKPRLWHRPPPGVNDTLTTTALATDLVYVTRLRQRRHDGVQAAVLRFGR